jgi:hypothetical protein
LIDFLVLYLFSNQHIFLFAEKSGVESPSLLAERLLVQLEVKVRCVNLEKPGKTIGLETYNHEMSSESEQGDESLEKGTSSP